MISGNSTELQHRNSYNEALGWQKYEAMQDNGKDLIKCFWLNHTNINLQSSEYIYIFGNISFVDIKYRFSS